MTTQQKLLHRLTEDAWYRAYRHALIVQGMHSATAAKWADVNWTEYLPTQLPPAA